MTEFKIPELGCQRCGHHWVPRQTEVKICPKCKSPYWDIPKGQKRLVTVKPERHKVT